MQTMPRTTDITWNGIDLTLDADRALLLHPSRTLLIADVHLGKPATFRAHACPVPEAVTDADLARLTTLIQRHAPDYLIILGDLFHARESLTDAALLPLRDWLTRHDIAVTLVRGNHDDRAGTIPADLPIHVVDAPYAFGPLDLTHEPPTAPDRPTLAGHIHPGVSIRARRTGLRAPCFHFSSMVAVMPAFGRFTGLESVRARTGDRVFAVGEGAVIEVGHHASAR